MRRKKKTAAAPKPATFGNLPFRELHKGRSSKRVATALEPETKSAPPPPESTAGDDDIFQREMANVTPLPAAKRAVRPPPIAPRLSRPIENDVAETMAALSDLVSGDGPFDISQTTEFLQGAAAATDPRLVRRLRRGEFAYQSHLDLHGMTSDQARQAVDHFLNRAVMQGQRCVLIVHGRGLNSKDQTPVLKNRLTMWLARGAWARMVLAFTSARPCDGGLGAVYVLLRRKPHPKKNIRVTEGGG
jgi:DNA-nicking Smr family endonuclease